MQWIATPHKPAPLVVAVSRVRFELGGIRSLILRLLRHLVAAVGKLIEWIERKPPEE